MIITYNKPEPYPTVKELSWDDILTKQGIYKSLSSINYEDTRLIVLSKDIILCLWQNHLDYLSDSDIDSYKRRKFIETDEKLTISIGK